MEKRKKRGARGSSKMPAAMKETKGSKKGPKAAAALGAAVEGKAVATEGTRKAKGTMRSGASVGPKAKPMNAKPPSETAGGRSARRKRVESMDL